MERPGEKLRQARERLQLTYRDVAEASQKIAQRRNSEEFVVALSRLADIENKGTVPTIYRLYTLCAIYRLDWKEVLRWYGIPLDLLPADAFEIRHKKTHSIRFGADGTPSVPPNLEREIDLNKTTFLSHLVGRWGKMPLSFLAGLEQRHLNYGLVGLSDWSMYPVLQPGSLVLIDQNRRKVALDGWTSEFDRPIYFLEHRDAFYCRWCSLSEGTISLIPDPASDAPILNFNFPSEIEVIGQVVGVAMSLDPEKAHRIRP